MSVLEELHLKCGARFCTVLSSSRIMIIVVDNYDFGVHLDHGTILSSYLLLSEARPDSV